MLATIQRTLIAVAVAACLMWFARCATQGRPLLALLGPGALILVAATCLALEYVLLIWTAKHRAGLPRTSTFLRACVGEMFAMFRVFLWQQPFQEQRWPDHLPEDCSQTGVLLVHGYFCNRGIWNRWMRRLTESGTPFVAVSLEPVFGSINGYDAQIDRAVRKLQHCTGHPPVAVAHSMGGLVVRRWWTREDTRNERLRALMTFGTPHHGTWLARFAFSRNALQMRLGSDWLATLMRSEPVSNRSRTICYFSACDNVVFPAESAQLSGASNRELLGTAHVAMIDHPQAFTALLEVIAQAAAGLEQSAPAGAPASTRK